MLRTIVRALFLFVVLCLVAATRPFAQPHHDDVQARFEVANGNVELTPRRDGDRDPRDQRALALAIPAVPLAAIPPPRPPLTVDGLAPSRALVPIIFARSSRGPPVG